MWSLMFVRFIFYKNTLNISLVDESLNLILKKVIDE